MAVALSRASFAVDGEARHIGRTVLFALRGCLASHHAHRLRSGRATRNRL